MLTVAEFKTVLLFDMMSNDKNMRWKFNIILFIAERDGH